LNTSYRSC